MDRIKVMELVRSYQVGEVSRRDFLKRATVTAGGLVAANSLLAACTQFPNENPPPVVDESQPATETGMSTTGEMTTGVVEYPDTDDETLMGYLAYQSGGDPKPGWCLTARSLNCILLSAIARPNAVTPIDFVVDLRS